MSKEKSSSVEIKERMRGQYYASICTVIFIIVILIVVTIAVFSLAEPGFQTTIGMIILVIFWVLMIAILLFLVLKMRGGGKLRSFVLNDEEIVFEVPRKPIFKIRTTDFNTLEVSRAKKDDIASVILELGMQPSMRAVYYKFHFLEAAKAYIVESGVDFSKKALKRIRAALEEFCLENGKNYYFKK